MMKARDLTLDLGGSWHNRYGTAPCPVCQPEGHRGQNALTLSDGAVGLLLHCKKSACAFRSILEAAGVALRGYTPFNPAICVQRASQKKVEANRRAKMAFNIWRGAEPINGTLAETYLRGRGITCELPGTLRFQRACWHGAMATRLPAMVALIEGGADFAVHRTYLRADGTDKDDVIPQKAMLGGASGGAVRLTRAQGQLVVAEGIETALSLASGLLDFPANIWASLSTSGMRGLILPPSPNHLTIAPDGDEAGRSAAHALGERAHAFGWTVSTLPVPNGHDWNDILIMKAGKV